MHMNISELGIIFDFNGVIVNDERFHEESWRKMYQDRDFGEDEMRQHFFGKREREVFEFVVGRSITDEELSLLSDQRIEIVKKLIDQGVFPTNGLLELLKELKDQHIPYAIATSSRKPYLGYLLSLLELTGSFETIVSAEDVKHGKPDPEVFLTAAEKIKRQPKHCIVFEDTHSGIEAAHRAGMKVIALSTTHQASDLTDADRIYPDFEPVTLSILTDLVSS